MAACIICLEKYSQTNKPIVINCGHTFCNSCINKITTSYYITCPSCRKISNDKAVNYSLLELSDNNSINDSFSSKIKIVADFCSNIDFSDKKFSYNLIQETNNFIFDQMDEFGLMLTHSSLNIFTINLIEKGKISFNSNCWSNLMIASASGNVELVKYILSNYTDVNYISNDCYTALILASQNFRNSNSGEIVRLLIEKGADVNLTSFDNKYSALTFTLIMLHMQSKVKSTDLETTKILLENKADPNMITFGEIPLFIASRMHNITLVMLLIKYGADPNKIYDNNTALSQLFDNDRYIFEKIENVIIYLIGVSNINIRFSFGETLLMKAVETGCEKIADMLILNRADTTLNNIDDADVFFYAIKRFSMNSISDKLVERIYNTGININKRNMYGITPILSAVMCLLENANLDRLWIIDFLIEKGADFNIPCCLGNTPLIYANNYLRCSENSFFLEKVVIHLEEAIKKRNLILYPPPESFLPIKNIYEINTDEINDSCSTLLPFVSE